MRRVECGRAELSSFRLWFVLWRDLLFPVRRGFLWICIALTKQITRPSTSAFSRIRAMINLGELLLLFCLAASIRPSWAAAYNWARPPYRRRPSAPTGSLSP